MPKGLKKIGKEAFSYNVLLKDLIIPEGVREIGSCLLFFSILVERVRLPDSLQVLNEGLFCHCWKLKEVNMPSQLRETHGLIFNNCDSLPASVGKLPETLEIMDGALFYGNWSITEIEVPKNVRILNDAFSNMHSLRKVTILSDKLTEIGDEAFYCCSILKEVNIPYGIKRIGTAAFQWNARLRNVELPSTVTSIGIGAFDSDPLDSIDIPAGVSFIGRNAFWNNSNLKKVYCRPVLPPTTRPTTLPLHLPFEYSVNDSTILYVPKGSAEAYRASEVFSGFKNIVELEEWQWPTAINKMVMPSGSYKVYGENGTLHIEADGSGNCKFITVRVYSISGSAVWTGRMTDSMEIQLPKGFYVVRIGNTTRKISI